MSKDALIEAAWPGLAIEDGNLTVQISALRRVLGEEANGASWIETLPRRGYRYVGPPIPIVNGPGTPSQVISAPALPERPSLAVLPFSSPGASVKHAYSAFADTRMSVPFFGRPQTADSRPQTADRKWNGQCVF